MNHLTVTAVRCPIPPCPAPAVLPLHSAFVIARDDKPTHCTRTAGDPARWRLGPRRSRGVGTASPYAMHLIKRNNREQKKRRRCVVRAERYRRSTDAMNSDHLVK